MISNDRKRNIICTFDDIRIDILGPLHDTTSVSVISKNVEVTNITYLPQIMYFHVNSRTVYHVCYSNELNLIFLYFCLFELMLNAPVISFTLVATLPLFNCTLSKIRK